MNNTRISLLYALTRISNPNISMDERLRLIEYLNNREDVKAFEKRKHDEEKK